MKTINKYFLPLAFTACLIACKKSTPAPAKSKAVFHDTVKVIMNITYASPSDTVFWQLALFGTDTAGLWSGLITKSQLVLVKTVIPDTNNISEFDVAEWHWNFLTLDSVQCNIYVNGKQAVKTQKFALTNPPAELHFKD